VLCFGPSDVWVVGGFRAGFTGGYGAIMHHNGSDLLLDPMVDAGWANVQDGYSGLMAIWGSSSVDIWAVGGTDIYHLGFQ